MDINSCCRACLRVFAADTCKKDVRCKRSKIEAQFNECCGNGEQNIIEPPRYLCTDCSQKTREFYEFKQMCFNSMIKWITLRPVGCTYASVDSSCSSDECDSTSPSLIERIPVTSTTEENDCCEIYSAGHEDRYHVEIDSNEEANDMATEENEEGNDTTVIDLNEEANEMATTQNEEEHNTYIIDQIEDANDMAAEQNVEENDTTVIQHNEESNYTEIEQCDEIIETDVEDSETESDNKHEIGKRAQNSMKVRRTYKCNLCPRNYMLLSSYTGHMLEHQGVGDGLLCPEIGCNRTFDNNRDLSQHIRLYHTPKQSQVCDICGKVLKTPHSLKCHKYVHIDKSKWPLQCDYPNCGRRFCKSRVLSEHKIRHAGIKCFKCPHCEFSAVTATDLKKHVNLHTREREFPCPICSKVFYSHGQKHMHVLKKHEKSVLRECKYCRIRFRNREKLYEHERGHEGDIKYDCPECPRSFTQARHRTLHMQQKHDVKPTSSTRKKKN